VLDTNQLRFVLPGSPTLELLSVVAERMGHTLATTDIVIREVVRQRRDELTDALKARIKANQNYDRLVVRPNSRSLNPIPIGWFSVSSFVTHEVEEFETALRRVFLVLKTRPEDALEALFREADHRSPCSKGKGGRDASIWLTAARACHTPDVGESGDSLPVIFVSEDKGFLAADNSLPTSTALNATASGDGTLILKSTVLDALMDLGYARQTVNAADMLARMEIRASVLDAIIRSSTTILASSEIDALRKYEIDGPWLIGEKKAVQCRSDDVTLTCFGGYWKIDAFFSPSDRDGRDGPRLEITLEGMVLIIEQRDAVEIEVDFSPVRRLGGLFP
jgi:PIN domain